MANGTDEPVYIEDPEEEKEDDWLEYVAIPPDGGWGWVVVFASFCTNFVADGITYSYGIFLPKIQEEYNCSQSEAALVGSLLIGFMSIVGPFVGGLVNKLGSRTIMMTGSVIGCISFLLSAYATSVPALMLIYGVLGGIGLGFIYLPAIVHVGYYFEKQRALATGIAVSGSGAGTFIFAPLTVMLIGNFSWKGALWILAGLILNCAVFGALLRPLKPKKELKKLVQLITGEEEEEGPLSLSRLGINFSNFSSVQSMFSTAPSRQVSLMHLQDSNNLHYTDLHKYVTNRLHSNLSESSTGAEVDRLPSVQQLETLTEETKKEPDSESVEPSTPQEQIQAVSPEFGHRLSPPRVEDTSRARQSSFCSTSSIVGVPGVTRGMSYGYPRPSFDRSGSRMSTKSYGVSTLHRLLSTQSSVISKRQLSKTDLNDIDPEAFSRPMYRKDIFYTGSVQNIPEMGLVPTDDDPNSPDGLTGYLESTISIPAVMETTVLETGTPQLLKNCCSWVPPPIQNVLIEMIDIRLLRQPVMILLCVSSFIGMLGFYVPFIYLINRAEECGVHTGKSSFLLSIIGITNTMGRVFFGWFSDRQLVSALTVSNACLLGSGILTFLVPAMSSFEAMAFYAAAFGFLISAFVCLTSIVLVELLGLDQLTNSFGLVIMARGIAIIIGSPLAGLVYDATKSYDYSFYFGGALIIISALLSFCIPLITRDFCVKLMKQKAKEKEAPIMGATKPRLLDEVVPMEPLAEEQEDREEDL